MPIGTKNIPSLPEWATLLLKDHSFSLKMSAEEAVIITLSSQSSHGSSPPHWCMGQNLQFLYRCL